MSRLPSCSEPPSFYAPDFLLEGGRVDVPDDVPALAVRALDRVVAEASEWLVLWESDGGGQAVAVVQELRTVIAAAVDRR